MSWTLRTADLDDLARGAALLGTGGGGDPFVGKMLVTQALGEAGEITILDPEELDDDAWVIPVAQMGAPTVVVEKMPRGTEPELALITLEKHTGPNCRCHDADGVRRNQFDDSVAGGRTGAACRLSTPTGWGEPFLSSRWKPSRCTGFRRVRSPWRTSTTRWRSSTPEVTTADWRASPAG